MHGLYHRLGFFRLTGKLVQYLAQAGDFVGREVRFFGCALIVLLAAVGIIRLVVFVFCVAFVIIGLFRTLVRLKAGKHRIGIGRAVYQADFRQLHALNQRFVQIVPRRYRAADGKALVHTGLHLQHRHRIDHMRAEVGAAVVFNLDFNRRPCRALAVHLTHGAELHVIGDGRLHRFSRDDFAVRIDCFARSVAPHLDGAVVLLLCFGDFAV